MLLTIVVSGGKMCKERDNNYRIDKNKPKEE